MLYFPEQFSTPLQKKQGAELLTIIFQSKGNPFFASELFLYR